MVKNKGQNKHRRQDCKNVSLRMEAQLQKSNFYIGVKHTPGTTRGTLNSLHQREQILVTKCFSNSYIFSHKATNYSQKESGSF